MIQTRMETLMKRLPPSMDAALITSRENRLYLTGMQSSAGMVLLTRDSAYFIIDFRYIEAARSKVKGCEVLLQERLYAQLASLLEKHGCKTLGVESEYMTLSAASQAQERLPGVQLMTDSSLSDVLRRMRMIKSAAEVASITAAQRIAEKAFEHILGYIRPGRTEREIAAELLDYSYRSGSGGPSFDYIVASGPNSSRPHSAVTDRPVEAGDFITMDYGCLVDGYCSDMTRTVALGHLTDEQRSVYEIVHRAQLAGLAAARAGISCKTVDDAARGVIEKAGFGEYFGHSTGHSLGIEIHERPAFSAADETVCEAGMVLSVEPGIYLEGRFGVRIEDIILVTENGNENLTLCKKELIIL